jgi:dTDP-4-amino-4,6-dideoxygalactose transaminase
MLVTRSAEQAARARYLTLQAKEPGVEYIHGDVGFNTRLPGLQAALGIAQLSSLREHLAAKRRIAAAYLDGLAGLPGVRPLLPGAGVESAWWLFTILVDDREAGIGSRALLARLADLGIQTRPLWQPLPESPAYRDCEAQPWAAAQAFFRQGLSLPSSVGLTPEDQAAVTAAIRAIVGRSQT